MRKTGGTLSPPGWLVMRDGEFSKRRDHEFCGRSEIGKDSPSNSEASEGRFLILFFPQTVMGGADCVSMAEVSAHKKRGKKQLVAIPSVKVFISRSFAEGLSPDKAYKLEAGSRTYGHIPEHRCGTALDFHQIP